MTLSCIVGASAGLGRATATALAAKGHDLALVASDSRDLEACAQDLRLRFGVKVHCYPADLTGDDPSDLRGRVLESAGRPDNLLFLAGLYSTQDDGFANPKRASDIVAVNFRAPVLLTQAFMPDLLSATAANLVFAGSVATIRPRTRGAIYASAKMGIEFYARALQHALRNTTCRVQFYRFGYIATQMTFGQKLPIKAVQPTQWAERIARRLGRDIYMRHPSPAWRGVNLMLNALPWSLYCRLRL